MKRNRDEPAAAEAAGWGQAVATAALRAYATLPRTGKPGEGEWSALAAFVLCWPPEAAPRCVALATGTKCLGASARCSRGTVLADCHAEVLARRALQAWLYGVLASEDEPGLLLRVPCADAPGGVAVQLAAGAALHMYVSQPPCGDACVACESRTGAKVAGEAPLPSGVWREAGGAVQAAGAARRKPGRGEPTLSMSCSDKLARWTALGLQGALLTHFTRSPLPCASVSLAGSDAQLAPLQRAVSGRLAELQSKLSDTPWALQPPVLHAAPPPPPELAAGVGRPCGAALSAWRCGGAWVTDAVAANTGMRSGTTRATASTPQARSALCRAAQLARFRAALPHGHALAGQSYGAAKRAAPAGYTDARQALMTTSPLAAWIAKPAGEQAFG